MTTPSPFALDPRYATADRTTLARADRVRALNDAFRTTLAGGKVMLTPGVAGLSLAQQVSLVCLVRGFDGFTPEDDPYEEHDFGAVELSGERYLWKIDAYDLDLRFASPDPSDPALTVRVMTLMRADEY